MSEVIKQVIRCDECGYTNADVKEFRRIAGNVSIPGQKPLSKNRIRMTDDIEYASDVDTEEEENIYTKTEDIVILFEDLCMDCFKKLMKVPPGIKIIGDDRAKNPWAKIRS